MRYETLTDLILAAREKKIMTTNSAEIMSAEIGYISIRTIWEKVDALRDTLQLRPSASKSVIINHHFYDDLQEIRNKFIINKINNDSLSQKQIGLIMALLYISIVEEYIL